MMTGVWFLERFEDIKDASSTSMFFCLSLLSVSLRGSLMSVCFLFIEII